MLRIFSIIVSILIWTVVCSAQFPGPAGTPGSTAIHKDSSIFVAWANSIELDLGPQDITDPLSPTVSVGEPQFALGPADGSSVISLGDGGIATLSFDPPIVDGPGFDFAVFENAFTEGFLELAFVEVSSDGLNYHRFNSVCLHDLDEQFGPFSTDSEAEKIDQLAGKYVVNYGTPFDIDLLDDHPDLDKQSIKYVRVIDVVGSIDSLYGSFDSEGMLINDPFPTAFSSGGFDLDAVGVIHQFVSTDKTTNETDLAVYPNPSSNFIVLDNLLQDDAISSYGRLSIYSKDGICLRTIENYKLGNQINIEALESGLYLFNFYSEAKSETGFFIRH
jgi:hypothetical protein